MTIWVGITVVVMATSRAVRDRVDKSWFSVTSTI